MAKKLDDLNILPEISCFFRKHKRIGVIKITHRENERIHETKVDFRKDHIDIKFGSKLNFPKMQKCVSGWQLEAKLQTAFIGDHSF